MNSKTHFRIFTLMIILLFEGHEAYAERRIALIIGNSTYSSSMGSLSNPVNDANDMSATLTSLGFEVISGINLTKKQMSAKVRLFDDKLSAGDKEETIGLFYYAGHGLEVEGSNYLVPVDAEMDYQEDARDEGVPLNKITSRMKYARNRMNIVILDACRNNPLPKRDRSATGGWGAFNDVASGMFIAYGTSPGRKAADGTGRNGLFTKHILQNIKTKGKTLEQVFKLTRSGVLDESRGKQLTWSNNATTGDFYFSSPSNNATYTKPALLSAATIVLNNKKANAALYEEKYEIAFNLFTKSANLGDTHAQTYLGYLYHNGLGVSQNHNKAHQWYKKAADQNHPTAIYNVGTLYESGSGVIKNIPKAYEMYQKSASLGNQIAMDVLKTKGIQVNVSTLIGFNSSQINSLNQKGNAAISEKKYAEAINWYKQAANLGDPFAMNYIGYLNESGLGVSTNYQKAFEWYTKASEKDYAPAYYNLAIFYYGEKGVPANEEEKIKNYKKASQLGYQPATDRLNELGIQTN